MMVGGLARCVVSRLPEGGRWRDHRRISLQDTGKSASEARAAVQ